MATNLYETDFVAWTAEQAAELRRLRDTRLNTRLDLDLLAEEVEEWGSELRFAVRSHVARIIEHLLKIEFSPAHEPRHGWRRSVRNARDEAEQRMAPTIRRDVEKQLPKMFERARREVADSLEADREHDALEALPTLNPYGLDEILELTSGRRSRLLGLDACPSPPWRRTSQDRVGRLSFERRTRR